MFSTIIYPELLHHFLNSDLPRTHKSKPIMVFDCTFDLMKPELGQQQYDEAHIPGAVYVNLDKHLSAKNDPTAASGGRHPLPSRETFAAWLSSIGFTNGHQAVVYDRNGMNYCGRLWWMLKWVGHEPVAVLDGGLQAWQAAGGEVESTKAPSKHKKPHITPSNFAIAHELATLTAISTVANNINKPSQTILDARGAPRFRGEVEPLDPVAGHIPGALNRPFTANIGADGKFKPAEVLKAEFAKLLAGRNPATVVHHCGSGVSAVPNLLAMELAGLGRQALFAGSWSEWCSDPTRPVALG
jgi:thiosulfate/3-mercaptopyruvate sulfurtransferase